MCASRTLSLRNSTHSLVTVGVFGSSGGRNEQACPSAHPRRHPTHSAATKTLRVIPREPKPSASGALPPRERCWIKLRNREPKLEIWSDFRRPPALREKKFAKKRHHRRNKRSAQGESGGSLCWSWRLALLWTIHAWQHIPRWESWSFGAGVIPRFSGCSSLLVQWLCSLWLSWSGHAHLLSIGVDVFCINSRAFGRRCTRGRTLCGRSQ